MEPHAVRLAQVPAIGVFAPQKGNADYFIYPLSVASIAPGVAATAVVQLQISADSDFYWNATSVMADIAGAVQTDSSRVLPLVTVQIQDQGSNRNLFNSAVPITGIAGANGEPYRLVHPRLFTRATSISATFVNISAATTYANLFLLLHGFKVYSL